MAVKFRDYYEVLGVSRTATQEDIQRAYRKLARKYHPDVNKAADAEEKFKQLNEAHEVLKNPDNRSKYDQLGEHWQSGQDFRPPPGWESQFGGGAGGQGAHGYSEFQWGGGGEGFSDFFETLFGGGRQSRQAGGAAGARGARMRRQAGEDQEASVTISLEDAYRGATKSITLTTRVMSPQGMTSVQEKNYDVKIPAGILSGQKVRLSGQGGEGLGGGPRGDLYLKLEIEPHSRYILDGRDISMVLPVSPWEAVLGAEVRVESIAGTVTLKIPPGTQGGKKLRMRGKGMPNLKGVAGDFYVVVQIATPSNPSPREVELFEELKKVSTFNPRA